MIIFCIQLECAGNLIMQNILEVFWFFVVSALAPMTIYPFIDEHDKNS